MEAKSIEFKNYRSIKDLKIDLNKKFNVYVGKNETGKTNILNGIALLGGSGSVEKIDVRFSHPDEPPVTEAWIRMHFQFTSDEESEFASKLSQKFYSPHKTPVFCKKGNKQLSVDEFVRENSTALFEVNIIKNTSSPFRWAFKKDIYTEFKQWHIVIPGKVAPGGINDIQGNPIVGDFVYYDIDSISDEHKPFFNKISIEKIYDTEWANIADMVNESIPEIISWRYSEDSLLPNKINIANFCANIDTCKPLKNMFILSGYNKIKETIDDVVSDSIRLKHLLNKVSKNATTHFRERWPEYGHIEFELTKDGDSIIASIKDSQNSYEMRQRSDGFKRFVTFLLMISVRVKTKSLSDVIFVIDEPEIALHPTGIDYLRDELISISKSNYVFVSTHSIFMVDKTNIDSHYIVAKSDEQTNIVIATDSNIFDEEVLYNALGYSTFQTLKEKNVIFEGWSDKHLFNIAIKKKNVPTAIKTKFKSIGISHVAGAKQMKMISPILELAERNCIILSDSDAPSLEKKKEFESAKLHGKWLTTQELLGGSFVTAEDFMDLKYLETKYTEELSHLGITIDFNTIDKSKGIVIGVKSHLVRQGCQKEASELHVKAWKNKLITDLESKHIVDDYAKLIEELDKHV